MSSQKILMACTHAYNSALQVGSQHLARGFAAKGWEVHYLSAPVTPLHAARLNDPDVRHRFEGAMQFRGVTDENGIQHYCPFACIAPDGRPFLNSSGVMRHWARSMVPSLKWFLRCNDLDETTVLYIDNLSYHFLLDWVTYEKSLFRVMDVHEGFPGWKGKALPFARKIAQRADVTVYSALGLKSYAETLSPVKTAMVPNGVDFDMFNTIDEGEAAKSVLDEIPGPVALYTGAVDSRVDFDAVQYAAAELPSVSFVFVGPTAPGVVVPRLPDNVFFFGGLAHAELPAIMHAAAVGIIPFDVDGRRDLMQGIRPLKLLEYMAAGLPVVCADWEEVRNMDSPVLLYSNHESFVRLIRQSLHEHDPMQSVDYARHHDWKQSCEQLFGTL